MSEFMPENVPSQVVQVGSTVTLSVNGATQRYRIVGDVASAPEAGNSAENISAESQIGQLLMGRAEGEEAEIVVEGTPKRYKILTIE